jgi:hypothetical protein
MPAPTYYLIRNSELAAIVEATYGTKAGDPLAGSFFKQEGDHSKFSPTREEFYRDGDRDYGRASVIEMATGRGKTTFEIPGRLVPNGTAATPTAPDMNLLYKMLMGAAHTGTAHTTTAAGSAGTSIVLTTGGVAASGLVKGDLIAIDVSAVVGIEVRQVVNIATDTLTIDRACTADPAISRNVYLGTTYTLSESVINSASFFLFLGAAIRYQMLGGIISEATIDVNHSSGVPEAKVSFKGEGQPMTTHVIARPTFTSAGAVLCPDTGKVWIGASKLNIVQSKLSIKNGLQLRSRESDALVPNGAVRTAQKSRYNVDMDLDMYLTDAMETATLFAGGDTRTTRDVMIQLGQTAGKIVAWRAPAFRPKGAWAIQQEELGLKLSGRCLGTNGDDEVAIAFL